MVLCSSRLFEKFFFSHIALFEGHLEKMRLDVEKAYYTGKWNLFLTGMIEVDLYMFFNMFAFTYHLLINSLPQNPQF